MPAIVDFVLAVLLIEGLILFVFARRSTRRSVWLFMPNLLAGLCLILALRSTVRDAGDGWVLCFLALGGVAHAVDMLTRWRSSSIKSDS